MVAVFCFNLLGDGLRDMVDPRRRTMTAATRALRSKGCASNSAPARGIVRALDNVSFSVDKGETMALVGESGSGKSVTAYAVMGILDPAGRVTGGSRRCSAGSICWRPSLASLPRSAAAKSR